MTTEENKKKCAEATRLAIQDQLLAYDNVLESELKTDENEREAYNETVKTIVDFFLKYGWQRPIQVCSFCARNGMQEESEICWDCPASPKIYKKLQRV